MLALPGSQLAVVVVVAVAAKRHERVQKRGEECQGGRRDWKDYPGSKGKQVEGKQVEGMARVIGMAYLFGTGLEHEGGSSLLR